MFKMAICDQSTGPPLGEKRLRNGGRYRLRAPRAEDKNSVAQCFEQLSPESRRTRFFAVKKALTDAELEFLTITDGNDHIAVAAMALNDDGSEGPMLGMARCLRLPAPSEAAELAIAVVDDAQGVGLGQALVEQLMRAAAPKGIARFEVEVLAENAGMRALAKRFGGVAEYRGDGMLRYQVPVKAGIAEAPAWSWLETGLGFGAMRQDWLDSTDQVFRLSQELTEELWQGLWDLWHPARRTARAERPLESVEPAA